MRKFGTVAGAAMILVLAGGSTSLRHAPHRITLPAIDGNLSVLTYNVEGLPWPVTAGRADALALIGDRLHDLRARGQAPHVVVLQEAFTADARGIGRAAGYRYVIGGPAADAATGSPAADAHWWNGETEGKVFGSGLQILSDYPVSDVRRLAFPADRCAGYDCLANKGALLVRIAVPGVAAPVDIVTTHLNSRTASGVAHPRADRAYAAQVALLGDFVARYRDPRHPLIVAGDFNTGRTRFRRDALFSSIAARWAPAGSVRDALGRAAHMGLALGDDALRSRRHAKDWQFFASGHTATLALTGIATPFGHDPDGLMLSDHIGYTAHYQITPL